MVYISIYISYLVIYEMQMMRHNSVYIYSWLQMGVKMMHAISNNLDA